jgi:outer membrane protein assembly factor BamD (BamD/ComL family)
MTWIYPLALVLSLAVLAGGIYLAATHRGWHLVAAGAACVIAVLVTWPLALHLARSASTARQIAREAIAPMNERMEQFSIMLNMISEQQLLSDRAKSVAFREKDREALRRALQEEIASGDFEAALALTDDMERSFGYRQEAERMRAEIKSKREEQHRKRVAEVSMGVERHVRDEHWPEAHREAQRLIVQFPNDPQIAALPQEIENRKQQFKKQLIDSLHDAVNRRDTDGSLEILKKLDAYLTQQEAEPLHDMARHVIKQKLDNLRTQFSIAVQEHAWAEAIRLGEEIMRDFPNTQMAKEVRDRMDGLRQRAAGGEVEAATT